MEFNLTILIAALLLWQVHHNICQEMDNQLPDKIRLVHALGTSPRARHLVPTSEPLIVSIGVYGLSVNLLHENEFSAVVELRTWRQTEWTDPTLRWDPAQFGGVSSIEMPLMSIYVPDIDVENDLNPIEEADFGRDVIADVTSQGQVIAFVDTLERILCLAHPNVTKAYYCELILGSRFFDVDAIDLKFKRDLREMDLSEFTRGKYAITDNMATKYNKEYTCCPGVEFAVAVFNFTVMPSSQLGG